MISSNKISIPAIDAHLHFVNFVQKTDGIDALLKAMDKSNIKKTVLFGLPVIKKWNAFEPEPPQYYLDDDSACYYYTRTDEILAEHYLTLSEENKKRFAPLVCGFNPTDKFAVDYLEEMVEKYPFWRGVGEVFLRHDELTNITMGEVSRLNHPAMFRIYKFCAKKNLPILIHQNSSSVGNDNYKYLHELEKVLKKSPDTIFVWSHVGISRRIYGPEYYQMIDAILEQHSNLFVDISWVAYEKIMKDHFAPKKSFLSLMTKHFTKLKNPDSHVRSIQDSWLGVIQKHIDKIMLGSDALGTFENMGASMARYNDLLSHLTPEEQEKIAYKNANKLWFKDS